MTIRVGDSDSGSSVSNDGPNYNTINSVFVLLLDEGDDETRELDYFPSADLGAGKRETDFMTDEWD